jgi:hypothetical protein
MTRPDICEACGEPGYEFPRCKECGSVDEASLHDLVKLDLAAIAEMRRASTLARSNRAVLDYCEGIVRKAVGK